MTFAKKMLSSGFYHNEDTKMTVPFRHHGTFFGDPVRAIITASQNEVIAEDKLSQLAAETGEYVKGKLNDLSKKHPQFVSNVRGKGTYLAFDVETTDLRNSLISHLKAQGVNQGGCGVRTMRLRPTLYFEKKHADIYIDALDKAIEAAKKESGYIFYEEDCSFINPIQEALHKRSIEHRDEFWAEQAENIHWFKKP